MPAPTERRSIRVAAGALALALALLAPPDAGAAWRQRTFVIGGQLHSSARDRGSISDAGRLLAIQQAGINLLVTGDWFDSTEARRASAMADSLRRDRSGFDLRIIAHYVRPANPTILSFNPAVRGNAPAIEEALQPDFGLNNPSVEGWMVWDEPWTAEDMAQIRDMTGLMRRVPASRDKLPLVNLLPIYASGQARFDEAWGRDKVAAYRRYLDAYLGAFADSAEAAPLLCVDHYPFQTPQRRRDWFLNLAMVRDAAQRHGRGGRALPFWMVLQLSPWRKPDGTYRDAPDTTQVRWQVFSSLAYGAKGIVYWTLVPGIDGEFGPGLLDWEGRPTARYEPVRRLNGVLRALGPTLLPLQPVGVWHQRADGEEGMEAQLLSSPRSRAVLDTLSGGEGDGLVGLLRDPSTGADYLWVVNKSLDSPRSFNVGLGYIASRIDRINERTGAADRLTTRANGFDVPPLPPGTGVLYRVTRP